MYNITEVVICHILHFCVKRSSPYHWHN